MSFIRNEKNGLVYMTSSVIKARHCFTTRYGGVSEGSLSSLNLGENRGDNPENVRENYRLLSEATGIDTSRIAFTKQVHENNVQLVTSADTRALFEPSRYTADGVVTAERGVTLICYTADCVPVLLCDSENGVIAALHCGWRSSVADIIGVAVGKMLALGAKTENICAAIGPAIGKCCFEVGGEVVEAARTYLGGELDGLVTAREGIEGKYLLDLHGANKHRLLQLGLLEENISVSDECTMCKSDKYWSHRVTRGDRGSQAALIVLE